MAKTLQERYQTALEARGETVVKRLTGCIVMTRTKRIIGIEPIKNEQFYYLGKSGRGTKEELIECISNIIWDKQYDI